MLEFLIIGIQKSGTTMLKKNLALINKVYIPNKEIHFFDNHYNKGIEWYESHFNKNKICGEKTPNYITSEEYIKKIKLHYPNIKLIIIFRNPITRALSHWNHFNQIYDKSKKWGWQFNDNLLDSLKNNKDILTNGHYYEQLKNVYKYFEKDKVLILINEKFKNNSKYEMTKLCDFLGTKNTLNNISNAHERKYNNEILITEIQYLINYYKDKLESFYQLLGYRVKEWDLYISTFLKEYSYTRIIKSPIIKSNKITCIITCVNYSDILNITLPINKESINNIIVLTTPDDNDTINVCKQNNINYIETKLFYKKSKSKLIDKIKLCMCCCRCVDTCKIKCINKNKIFNKSKVINNCIKNYVKTDWVLLLDADIIVPNDFLKIRYNNLDINKLYGTSRIVYKTQSDWLNKENSFYDFWKFMGFFQLFNIKSKNFVKHYYGYNEKYNYANGGDYDFCKKWKNKELLDFYVVHLGETGENWEGRITELWD